MLTTGFVAVCASCISQQRCADVDRCAHARGSRCCAVISARSCACADARRQPFASSAAAYSLDGRTPLVHALASGRAHSDLFAPFFREQQPWAPRWVASPCR